MDIDDLVDLLYIVERVFDFKEIPKHKWVKLVAIKLRKNAFLWWENSKR